MLEAMDDLENADELKVQIERGYRRDYEIPVERLREGSLVCK